MKKQQETFHYEVWSEGNCEAMCNGKPWTATYEIGSVTSGRDADDERVYTRMIEADGREWIGHHDWSAMEAAKQLFATLADAGNDLVCEGLEQKYHTKGLTDGTSQRDRA